MVVLIIGILASIALPQYQKAVLRARYVQLVTLGDSICRASNLYYMANNAWTTNFDELDISLPPGGTTTVEGSGTTVKYPGKFWIKLLNTTSANLVELKLSGTGLEYVNYCYKKQKECRSYNKTALEQGVCASAGASKVACSSCTYDVYLF